MKLRCHISLILLLAFCWPFYALAAPSDVKYQAEKTRIWDMHQGRRVFDIRADVVSSDGAGNVIRLSEIWGELVDEASRVYPIKARSALLDFDSQKMVFWDQVELSTEVEKVETDRIVITDKPLTIHFPQAFTMRALSEPSGAFNINAGAGVLNAADQRFLMEDGVDVFMEADSPIRAVSKTALIDQKDGLATFTKEARLSAPSFRGQSAEIIVEFSTAPQGAVRMRRVHFKKAAEISFGQNGESDQYRITARQVTCYLGDNHEILQIEADGRVRLTMREGHAGSRRLYYDAAEQAMRFEGAPAQLSLDDQRVVGEVIYYDMARQRVRVERARVFVD